MQDDASSWRSRIFYFNRNSVLSCLGSDLQNNKTTKFDQWEGRIFCVNPPIKGNWPIRWLFCFVFSFCKYIYCKSDPNRNFPTLYWNIFLKNIHICIICKVHYFCCAVGFLITIYYNQILAWTFFYLYAGNKSHQIRLNYKLRHRMIFSWGMRTELPWKKCDDDNSIRCFTADQETIS